MRGPPCINVFQARSMDAQSLLKLWNLEVSLALLVFTHIPHSSARCSFLPVLDCLFSYCESSSHTSILLCMILVSSPISESLPFELPPLLKCTFNPYSIRLVFDYEFPLCLCILNPPETVHDHTIWPRHGISKSRSSSLCLVGSS